MRYLIIALFLSGIMSCSTSSKLTDKNKQQKHMGPKKIQVIGNKFKVNFGGDFVFELNFQSENKMIWTPLKGDNKESHTEDITMTEIRPNVYMVYWKEEAGNTVVHIEDFANGKAYTNIATPDGAFYNLSGPLMAMDLSNTEVGKQNIPTTANGDDKIKVIDNKFKVNFGGDFVFKLNFHSPNSMTWSPLKGESSESHTENITMTEIRPNVYMVYWKEASGNRVVHVEDFAKEKAYTNITIPSQTFYNLNGPMTQIKNQENMELSNKEKAVALLNSFNTGDTTPVGYINPNKYIQHNLAVADGLEGFGELMKIMPPEGFKANVVRAFSDGDYVFTHTVYDFFGPKVGFDVFRFENGQIVEHWDNLNEVTPPNPSGRTQSDGTTVIKDLDKTEANKQVVEDFVTIILKKGEMDKLGNFINEGKENYLQHNSVIGDGLSGLGQAIEAMAKQGIYMQYETVHKVLGEGNFVLTISEGNFAGQHTSFYDMFRVENGKIVEHWDIVETILPEAERKNTNGKFNF